MTASAWKSYVSFCSIVLLLFVKESQMLSYLDPCSSHTNSYKLQPLYSSSYKPSYFSISNDYTCFWHGYFNKWTRFVGTSSSEITTSCPAYSNRACSTLKFNAYISSGNPRSYDGIVSRTLCLSTPGKCECYNRVTIQVKNCGSYMVYKMPYSRKLYYCSAVLCGKAEIKPTTPPKPMPLATVAVIAAASLLVLGIVVSVTVAIKVKKIPPRVNATGAQPTT